MDHLNLDRAGWPELPPLGLQVEIGGGIRYQVLGVCTVIGAEHTPNAAGTPGGTVIVLTKDERCFPVSLSVFRDHHRVVGSVSVRFPEVEVDGRMIQPRQGFFPV